MLLLGNYLASEFYMPTFRYILFHLYTYLPMEMEQAVPKRLHVKFRRRGFTRKKVYNKAQIVADFEMGLDFVCYVQ